MEKAEFLQSGILETYVLGMSTDEENALVEQMLSVDPDILREKEEIELSLEEIAQAFALVPPSQAVLRRKLESKLFTGSPSASPVIEPVKTMAQPPISRAWMWYSIAASVLFLVAIGFVIGLQDQVQESENLLAVSRQESVKLLELNRELASAKDRFTRLTHTMGEEGTRQVVLTSTLQQPSKAVVFWNPATHKVWLVNTRLPELPRDKQYQLWGIVDGKPVDAGVFDGGESQAMVAVELKPIARPQALAVTIENRGGVASPTLSTLCLKADI